MTVRNLVAVILLHADHERMCAKAMSLKIFGYISVE